MPQGLASIMAGEPSPLDGSNEVGAKVSFRIDALRLFDWMERSEQQMYMSMLDSVKEKVRRKKLEEETGISTGGPGGNRIIS